MGDTGADDLPGTLTVRAGQVVRLRLEGASGAGNRWRVHSMSPEGEQTVAVRVEVGRLPEPPNVPGGQPPASTSALEVLVVEARAPGTVEVELRLGRSWTPDQPLATRRLRVVVDE
jgi:hypothetical protein